MLDYQHPELVKRLKRKLKLSTDEAESRFAALKDFLHLCVTTPGPHIPRPEIDAAWHEFILYTRDYAAFCERYAGRFLHHQPAPERAAAECGSEPSCQGISAAECQCESCAHPFPDDDVRPAAHA